MVACLSSIFPALVIHPLPCRYRPSEPFLTDFFATIGGLIRIHRPATLGVLGDHCAVDLPRVFGQQEALVEIGGNRQRLAFEWVAEARTAAQIVKVQVI